ncbi:transcriptional regulatory protein C56F2.05c [Colletotrichum truncatum]|uniref:Transcriptional regulatory protein C56F2.05c n=1 Tax=Colletotrichum truncatum TaxID=5467 RepID=A0ACC3ZJ60_COLTU|nr:transcriptional regulatory protein C56F2.05c [Colletotrichum truncatum]KAF6791951.1 transcriptional regulatory protein C56F2.05c [Colletotrichum truncatum]
MASMSPASVVTGGSAATSNQGSVSPRQTVSPKNVAFELLFTESPQYRARLPMRVQIYPHDTTDSIVTTVKNFYGLYSGPTGSKGVSFEDENGITLIARYENFRNNMVVYVRVIEEPPSAPSPFVAPIYQHPPVGAQPYYSSDGYPLQPPPRFGHEISRPSSRTSRKRSPSPNASRGRRSGSANTNPKKGRSRSSKNRDTGANGHADIYSDSVNGYSSGDGAPGSSSGRAKEQIGNTEISVENIVEGGRRKRAKFESSELPLFAPPQMPAATSNPSVSPARRTEPQRPSLPFVQPGHNPFTNPMPLQSPQSHNNGYGHGGYYATPSSERHARGSIGYPGQGGNYGSMGGILPTPDPTVGSCMSEEDKDVAIQLMRLGEMSNISHGRTSASTLDDTFSGRADAASSTGATSDGESESEEESPAARHQKLDAAGIMRKIYQTTESHFIPQPSIEPAGDDAEMEESVEGVTNGERKPEVLKNKTNLPDARPKTQLPGSKAKTKVSKVPRPSIPKPKKAPVTANGPMSPASLPPSRKPSITSAAAVPGAPGEEEQLDLSAKPRCQRCRKSKKGCDRQRPCGRCRDAGLSADQCISEDEGNGRKGRYGRHMGVPIKKEDIANPTQPILLPAAPIATTAGVADKNKKRKR